MFGFPGHGIELGFNAAEEGSPKYLIILSNVSLVTSGFMYLISRFCYFSLY